MHGRLLEFNLELNICLDLKGDASVILNKELVEDF